MKLIRNMSLAELAAFVCSHLKKHDINVVLTGGGCVSIYTTNQYQSFDLDFIETMHANRRRIKEALSEIGFYEEHRYFKHQETKFFIEFPSGPLSVGNEPVKKIVTMRFSTGELALLSVTDCVKDRLAGYYHWNDKQCLEQAILVAENNDIDLRELRRWSKLENKEAMFEEIRKGLRHLKEKRCKKYASRFTLHD